jgi:hypothetical protein
MTISRSNKLQEHTYRALDKTKHQFRLFRMNAYNSSHCDSKCVTPVCILHNPIQGYLQTFDLHNCPRYRALSYEWGDTSVSWPIILNASHNIYVTSNLLRFLQACRYIEYLRSSKTSKQTARVLNVGWIWIDQICIDQHTDDERNHQVKLMGWIYSKASEIIAWLGPSQHAAKILEDLTLSLPRNENGTMPLDLLDQFTQLSYWGRLWIQQEVFLARNIIFMARYHLLPAWRLQPARDTFVIRREPALSATLNMHHFNAAAFPRLRRFGLLEAFFLFRHKQCSDPRDRVYAVLAMVHLDEVIPVDYLLSIEKLFEVVALSIVDIETCLGEQIPEPPKQLECLGRLFAFGISMFMHPIRAQTLLKNM